MSDIIILRDSRQQKEKHIIKEFDKQNIMHIQTKLDSADYMAIRYKNGFIKDYTTLIDTKKDFLEMCGNLCHTTEHERIKREIERARELGCKDFIFLIGEDKIKSVNDIINWSSPHTKVKGSTLFKIMQTMTAKYNVKFIIVPKKQMGAKIISLLTCNN